MALEGTEHIYPIIGRKYKHYKGGNYEVITLATHTETGEAMVIYKSLEFGSIHARPLTIWNEKVSYKDDLVERFNLIENSMPEGMFDFKKARIAKQLTLREVELATGLSNAYLSQLERGKIKRPSFIVIRKLHKLYNT